MTPVKFTILGDPVPYLRMTQGQIKLMRIPDNKTSAQGMKVKNRIRRYLDWKRWVHANSCEAIPYMDRSPKTKIYLDLMIYFAGTKRGDMDNYYKGILDAIFDNDKNVCGCMDWDYDKDNPRCEIIIREME